MADLSGPIDHLNAALQALRQSWQNAAALWNDSVRRNFEQEHWSGIERETQATQQQMARLAQVIARARKEVR